MPYTTDPKTEFQRQIRLRKDGKHLLAYHPWTFLETLLDFIPFIRGHAI